MTADKFVIHGQSPEANDHEWTGCGWGDVGHGVALSDVESWMLERRINTEGKFTAWRKPAK